MSHGKLESKHWRGFAADFFGADLNSDSQKAGGFSGLTSPRSACECWQDPVRADHGVRALDDFSRIVHRYVGNSGVRTLTCAEQLRAMAFAQLTWRESLRDIEASLAANITVFDCGQKVKDFRNL